MRPNLFDDPPRHEPARPSRPMGIAVADVCPHCKRETWAYRFESPDGVRGESHRCREHGDVVPKRAPLAVAYPEADPAPRAKWSVPC